MNQSRARTATCASAPGSSKRWVAPGITRSSEPLGRCSRARRLRSSTTSSAPPTMQERRGAHGLEPRHREVGPPSARDDRLHVACALAGSPQRRGSARAGAEGAERKSGGLRLTAEPGGRAGKPSGEERDVEHVAPVKRLVDREQVEEQRSQPRFVQDRRDEPVTGARPPGAAAVRERDDPRNSIREHEAARQDRVVDLDRHLAFRDGNGVLCEARSGPGAHHASLPLLAGSRMAVIAASVRHGRRAADFRGSATSRTHIGVRHDANA